VRLVDLDDVADRLRDRYPDQYTPTRLPRDVYRTKRSVGTVSVSNYLVSRRDLPERIANGLTAVLFAHRSELASVRGVGRHLDAGAAIDTYPLDLHPGARRYYADAAR
jgi:TRAP-type uncharacterized transport system substrate-binding protein